MRGDQVGSNQDRDQCRGHQRAAPQGHSGQDPRRRIGRAGRRGPGRRRLPGRAIRPPGAAGTRARRRAGHRGAPGAGRRPVGADAAGDRDHRTDRPRTRPRRHQLGRLAQRGRPLDRADGLEGGPVGQRRALPVHPRRARRHRHRVRRRRLRTDRPELRPPAAARWPRSRNSRSRSRTRRSTAPTRGTRTAAGAQATAAARRPARPYRRGKTCCSAFAPAAASASSAIHAPATPTAAPSTNHRQTGSLRHPHTVGASPPTAIRLRPTASSG